MKGACLDQNSGCSPCGKVISERGRRPLVTVPGNVARDEFLQCDRDGRCDALITLVTRSYRFGFIAQYDEKGNSRLPVGLARRRQRPLVMQVKADRRIPFVTQSLKEPGLRGAKVKRIPVYVDTLQVRR